MQSTIKDADGNWRVHARLCQPTDDDYFVTTVHHPDADPGDTVTVETPRHDFTGVVLSSEPVVTLSQEVTDAF